MKTITIKLKDLLQAFGPFTSDSYLSIKGLVESVKSALTGDEELEDDVTISLSMEQLQTLFLRLGGMPEFEYAGCNARLLDAMIALASTDQEVADFLQVKMMERMAIINGRIADSASFFNIEI